MKIFTILILIAVLADLSSAIDKCTLQRTLRNSNLIGYKGYSLGDYMCLAHHASNYDTSLNRSPTEYGIFQINSYWWCDDGYTPGRKNLCQISCRALLNTNLSDDINCLKIIVRDPNGLGAWAAWRKYCKGHNLSSYTRPC
ncbi:lysozyme C-like [Rhinoderma darwinii]|uniref:lysozyme C-like n=1 Tax=Rhinoderma darwinii TaxID=43563 RepID=UPI003F67D64B